MQRWNIWKWLVELVLFFGKKWSLISNLLIPTRSSFIAKKRKRKEWELKTPSCCKSLKSKTKVLSWPEEFAIKQIYKANKMLVGFRAAPVCFISIRGTSVCLLHLQGTAAWNSHPWPSKPCTSIVLTMCKIIFYSLRMYSLCLCTGWHRRQLSHNFPPPQFTPRVLQPSFDHFDQFYWSFCLYFFMLLSFFLYFISKKK